MDVLELIANSPGRLAALQQREPESQRAAGPAEEEENLSTRARHGTMMRVRQVAADDAAREKKV